MVPIKYPFVYYIFLFVFEILLFGDYLHSKLLLNAKFIKRYFDKLPNKYFIENQNHFGHSNYYFFLSKLLIIFKNLNLNSLFILK